MGIIVQRARRGAGAATGAADVAKKDSGRAVPTKDDGARPTGAAATKPVRGGNDGMVRARS
jgi:hypothetical protein